MGVFIAPIGPGLGDLIICLPTIQWLINSGEPTTLVLRSPRQNGLDKLIPGLAGCVREVDLPPDVRESTGADRYINLRAHPLQTDHIWGSPEFEAAYPGLNIVDIVRRISLDFGIDADFEKLIPVPFSKREDVAGAIVFVPGSDGLFKCWSSENWLEFHRRLVAAGHEVVMIGQPEHSAEFAALLKAGGDAVRWVPTPTMRDALDVISSAQALASVDTGLMHLALHQGTPVAATWINNPASLTFLRRDKHCFPIVSPPCQSKCITDEMEQNMNLVTEWSEWRPYASWRCTAPAELRCMDNITVESFEQQIHNAIRSISN